MLLIQVLKAFQIGTPFGSYEKISMFDDAYKYGFYIASTAFDVYLLMLN